MKILVTGGAGFIGSALIRRAIAEGHSVLNVDKLTYAASRTNLESVEDHPAYQFTASDICNQDEMTALLEAFVPDTLMHLAAESHVDRSIDGPAEFITTNIVGTFALLEAARTHIESGKASSHFRFHHISTDEVFGSLGPTGAFTETSPYKPNSPYSASKASSDMLVRAWAETYGLPALVSNCSNNYGPCQFPEKLIPTVILKARAGEMIPIYGTGENVRDWLHVDDHAEALLLIAQEGVAGETYNVGGRAERSNIDLVKQICAIMDTRLPAGAPHAQLIQFVTDRPGHDQRYAVDCTKIERELGWAPKIGLDDGLAQTVDWYLTNQAWTDEISARGHSTDRLGLGATQGEDA